MSESITAQALRLAKFVARHQLWDKFIAEDAAGKR
jgi:hypothetical protein